VTVNDLLYGLMMVSGNDAAVALAEYIGGSISTFADMMNQKASELGLSSTHFVSPHGLDHDEHYTTAYELAIISNYALQNETFSKIVNTSSYTVTINGNPKSLHNTNELLGYLDGVYGIKTGFTNGANRCLVTACKRGDLDIICVVLGCDTKKNRTIDSINLINYIFDNFSVVNIKDDLTTNFDTWKSQSVNNFSINKGVHSNLNLYFDEKQIPYSFIAVNNSTIDTIKYDFSLVYNYDAPLLKDTKIGNIDVFIDNKFYFSVDILNENTVERKNIFTYIDLFLKNYFNYF
jgi:D-alanyl-D-alanine carboxypeptidase (penicillin-binding protein 5/6)